jgi:hypothetical protein
MSTFFILIQKGKSVSPEKIEEKYNIKNIFYVSERKEKRQKCPAVK